MLGVIIRHHCIHTLIGTVKLLNTNNLLNDIYGNLYWLELYTYHMIMQHKRSKATMLVLCSIYYGQTIRQKGIALQEQAV